jgi:hypothetical protein
MQTEPDIQTVKRLSKDKCQINDNIEYALTEIARNYDCLRKIHTEINSNKILLLLGLLLPIVGEINSIYC